MHKTLVAIDLSSDTEQIIQKSIEMAKAFSSIIYFVHVQPPIKDSSGRDNGDPIEEMSNDYPDQTGKLNHIAQRVRDVGIETHALFIEGIASLSIIETAQKMNAQLIIMGSHGHGAVTSFLLVSVSQAVVKKAMCPVLLVPIRKQ